MAKTIPSYLKLRGGEPHVAPPDVEVLPGLEALCDAFTQATGWPLAFGAGAATVDQPEILWSAPVNPGVGASPGHLRIELGQPRNIGQLAARMPLEAAETLADSILMLLRQTVELRDTVWKREAELAAGVPIAARPDEPQHLAWRLEAALKSGAQLLGCDAAALYALDEATTELKLRSSWGLPFDRLQQPARPLAAALADLEALLGHAVALETTSSLRPWNVPESCQSALCVPVSSPTMPLGTLWFFSQSPRPFTAEQTNLAEMIAGRLAAELDRALLLHEQMEAMTRQQGLDQAGRMQQAALNLPSPIIQGYEVAGWTRQAHTVGGAFHDWRMLCDGRLALVVSDAVDGGMAGAISATGIRATLRTLVNLGCQPVELLPRLHEFMAEQAAGDQWAGIALAIVCPRTGEISLSSAGRPSAIWIQRDGGRSLLCPSLPLGLDDNGGDPVLDAPRFAIVNLQLAPGDALALYTRGIVEAGDEQGRPLDEAALAQALFRASDRSASELLDVVCDRQEAHALAPHQFDRSVVVIKRLDELR